MQTEQFIQELLDQTKQLINAAEQLKTQPLESLTWKENATAWSVLECLEHLNLYGDFYLPEIERQLKSSKRQPESVVKSGWLGNYFAESMLPKEQMRKMNTFKDKNPLHASLTETVIDRFLHQQFKLLEVLNLSRGSSLNKVKIKTSISPLLRLKLGDTFRFIINHNIRHFAQIERISVAMKNV